VCVYFNLRIPFPKIKKMEKLICEFCKKEFSRKDNLITHQKKSCKKHNCKICGKTELTEEEFKLHTHSANEIEDKVEELETKIKDKVEELEVKIKDKVEELESKIKDYEEKIFAIASKPQTINTTMNNNNIRIEKLQPLIIHQSHMMKVVEEKYNYDYWNSGQSGVANFAHDHFLLDDNGKSKYICTDISRGAFHFKNKEGSVIKDIGSKQLTNKLAKAIIPKSIKIHAEKTKEAEDEIQKKVYDGIQSQIIDMKYNNKEFIKELGYLTGNDEKGMESSEEEESEDETIGRQINIGSDDDNEYILLCDNETEAQDEYGNKYNEKSKLFDKK
jgi:hypothetical protein